MDGDNLALRAARLLAEVGAVRGPGPVSIRKDIPVTGGMAGGSADAAAALVACDQLWGLGLPATSSPELAAELGSDVPFLALRWHRDGIGRGELLAPVLARGSFHWVFALSRERPVDPGRVCRVRPAARRRPTCPTRSPTPR